MYTQKVHLGIRRKNNCINFFLALASSTINDQISTTMKTKISKQNVNVPSMSINAHRKKMFPGGAAYKETFSIERDIYNKEAIFIMLLGRGCCCYIMREW